MAFESDWTFLKAALPDLQEYILSSEIYWTLRPPSRSAAGVQIPQLTIGNLLLSQARLSAAAPTAHEKEELANLSREIDVLRDEWRANWGQKAGREHTSRLNLWQQYLGELRGNVHGKPAAQSAYYAREVRNRAILRLLRPEVIMGTAVGLPAAEREQLDMLDQVLKGLTRESPFVWEPEAQSSFPREGFWFLYAEPLPKP